MRWHPAVTPVGRRGLIRASTAARPATTSTRTAPGCSTRCPPAAARAPRRSPSRRASTWTPCCAAWAGWPATDSSNAVIAAGACASPDRDGPPRLAGPGRRAIRVTASRDLGVHLVLDVRLVCELELELQVAVPGQVLQPVPLDVLRIAEADHPQALTGQPLVDLVEMVADQLLLGVGDLSLVRLARMLAGRVVEPVPARAAAGRCPRAAPDRPGGGEQLGHGTLRGQLVEGVGLHDDAARLDVVGQVHVDDRHPQGGLLHGLAFLGECLDLDRAVAELGVLVDHDACQCVVMHDELAAQVAEPDSLLTHARSLSKALMRARSAVGWHCRRDAGDLRVNAWITLPQACPRVKLQFDRRVGVRN